MIVRDPGDPGGGHESKGHKDVQSRLLPDSDDDCKCSRSQHELTEIVLRRLDQQDEKIDAHSAALADLRGQVSNVADLLKILGDSCYSLASAVNRLTADS